MNKKYYGGVFILLLGVVLAGCSTKTEDLTKVLEPEQVGEEVQEHLEGADDFLDRKADSASNVLKDIKKEEKTMQDTMKKTRTADDIDIALAKTCTGATITTNHGVVTVSFHGDKAPKTVANFCTLAKDGYYDGVIFHRVIQDFMIQGGDPTGTGTGGPGYKFEDELPGAGEYKLGSLAMANAGPNTNGSQFFIVSGDAGVGLPPAYSLFGQVTEGMDTVMTIQNVETAAADRPVKDVVIEKIELVME